MKLISVPRFGLIVLSLCAPRPLVASTPLTTVLVASGLARPVHITAAPGDAERLFILEQHTGRIVILKSTTGLLNATPFLTVGGLSNSGSQGLLGLAFHPDYQSNGWFYVNYTDSSGTTVIERYARSPDPDIADPSTAFRILTIERSSPIHNGGWLAFGPIDKFLYIASGDGSNIGDPENWAQDLSRLQGKILRIDVDGDDFPADPDRNYANPPDNPFVGVTGEDEIWAYGLRNPWRCAFDSANGDLYIADVGEASIEEIDFQPASSNGGENYGWRCYEGSASFNPVGCPEPATMVFPIHEYAHGGVPNPCAVTGGYVYRGSAIPDLQGTYFFADFCSNQIWSFRYDGVSVSSFTDHTAELAPPGGLSIANISSFGEDSDGEFYICELGGEVFKIVPDDGGGDIEPCPPDPNGELPDLDQDGLPDVCDPDADGDGYEGALGDGRDCDDFDPQVNPDVQESLAVGNCADTIDNDCDAATDSADPACMPPCICGDMNESGGAENLLDFAVFGICFAQDRPTFGCDTRKFECSDLNADGLINLADFSTFAILFGQPLTQWSPPDCLQ